MPLILGILSDLVLWGQWTFRVLALRWMHPIGKHSLLAASYSINHLRLNKSFASALNFCSDRERRKIFSRMGQRILANLFTHGRSRAPICRRGCLRKITSAAGRALEEHIWKANVDIYIKTRLIRFFRRSMGFEFTNYSTSSVSQVLYLRRVNEDGVPNDEARHSSIQTQRY